MKKLKLMLKTHQTSSKMHKIYKKLINSKFTVVADNKFKVLQK